MDMNCLEQLKEKLWTDISLLQVNEVFRKETEIDCLVIKDIYQEKDIMSFGYKICIIFCFGLDNNETHHISAFTLEDIVKNIKKNLG